MKLQNLFTINVMTIIALIACISLIVVSFHTVSQKQIQPNTIELPVRMTFITNVIVDETMLLNFMRERGVIFNDDTSKLDWRVQEKIAEAKMAVADQVSRLIFKPHKPGSFSVPTIILDDVNATPK